jgi:hypothetical protein
MQKIIDCSQHPLSKNSYDQTLLMSRSTAVPSSPINFTPHTFCLYSDKCAERYSLFINPSHMFNHLQNNQAMKISSAYQGSSTNIFGDWGQPTQPHTLPPHVVSQKPFSCILEQFQTLPKFHNSLPYYKEKVKFCLLKKIKKYFEQVLFMQNFTYFLYMNENV